VYEVPVCMHLASKGYKYGDEQHTHPYQATTAKS